MIEPIKEQRGTGLKLMIIHMPVRQNEQKDQSDQKYIYQNVIAVTNRSLGGKQFMQQVLRVCCNQPKAMILRGKDMSEKDYFALASQVKMICSMTGVELIVYRYRTVARCLGIRSVHLALSELEEINESGGAEYDYFDRIGCTVHSLKEAKRAESLGADYLIASHMLETDQRHDFPARSLRFLQEVCDAVDLPVYAVGGISPDPWQIQEIKDVGAEGACVTSAAMGL